MSAGTRGIELVEGSQAIESYVLTMSSKLSLAIKEDTSFMRKDVAAIRDKQDLQWEAQKLRQHHAIMEWLSPSDFPAQQYDIICRRQEGTGEWFLETPEFTRWLEGSDKTLFCPGIPGAGKTMMAAITIGSLLTGHS